MLIKPTINFQIKKDTGRKGMGSENIFKIIRQMNRYSQQKSLKAKVSSSAINNGRAKVLGRRYGCWVGGSGRGRTI